MLIHTPQELAKLSANERRTKKISQALTAEKVGLKQTTVSKFEIRPESTQLDTLFRILSALDLEMHIIPKKSNKNWKEEW